MNGSSETLGTIYQIELRYTVEDSNIQIRYHESPKSHD
jgi:hypothetical protein